MQIKIEQNIFRGTIKLLNSSHKIIDFFYADFIFYNNQLKYQVSKPNTTNSILKNYFKNELKKLESKKHKNLKFYQYYKHKSTFLDHLYFLRENKQLDLFSIDVSIYLDSEFHTSHDKLAAEVIAYDLLTNFYKKEISKLKSISSGKFERKDFIIADAKDADMAMGIITPGPERDNKGKILKTFKIIQKPRIRKRNVNTIKFRELLQIPYIDYALCQKIFNYRDEVAELQEISELKNIVDFPIDKYDRIVLYLNAE